MQQQLQELLLQLVIVFGCAFEDCWSNGTLAWSTLPAANCHINRVDLRHSPKIKNKLRKKKK